MSAAKRGHSGCGRSCPMPSIRSICAPAMRRASSRPAESLAIWYDSYPNLVARGIIVRTPIARYQPDPFPNGFVADPPPRYR